MSRAPGRELLVSARGPVSRYQGTLVSFVQCSQVPRSWHLRTLKSRSRPVWKKTLYTFGYLSGKADRIVKELIALKTPVIDVRLSPNSKRYQWTKESLQKRPGILYHWLPNLGNDHYKQALTGDFQEPCIHLHDLETGLIELSQLLNQYTRVALMCACTSKETCHRILVASLARERLAGVNVIHL